MTAFLPQSEAWFAFSFDEANKDSGKIIRKKHKHFYDSAQAARSIIILLSSRLLFVSLSSQNTSNYNNKLMHIVMPNFLSMLSECRDSSDENLISITFHIVLLASGVVWGERTLKVCH